MATILQGNGGTNAEVDGTTWRALRTTVRPPEIGTGNGYYAAYVTAATAAAPGAAANLVSFRWTHASMLCMIQKVYLQIGITTASTAGEAVLGGYIARSFSAADSGGTAVTLTGNAFKKRTSFSTTALGDFRFAAAGTLTAGTRTLDGQPFILNEGGFSALGSGSITVADFTTPGNHPIILAQNEGLVFQNVVALTTAVYQYAVGIEWGEVQAY